MSVKFLPLLIGCALGGSAVQPAAAAPRVNPGVKTVLVVGDSLSDGFGLKRSEAYPALLAQKLSAAGHRFEVVNASASGGTTAGGLQRLPKYLGRKIDILVLELGINDAFRGVPIGRMRSNLQAMIDRTRARWPRAEIVIAGMQLPVFTQDDYMRAFGEMYRELAEENAAALVPYLLEGVAGNPALNLPDLIHPNVLGQMVLAENVWRVLEPLARRLANETRGTALRSAL